MDILVVNDDGIASQRLALLARAAAMLGRVWVVAPAGQCSAMSRRISVFGSMTLQAQLQFPVADVQAFSLTGTPADCVKVALQYLLPGKPDLVLSGMNDGYNVGKDTMYSGTVGAALEALMSGIPAIALSAGAADVRAAEAQLLPVLEQLLARPWPEGAIWNVNFPECPPEEVKGIAWDRFPAKSSYYCFDYQPTAVDAQGGLILDVVSHLEPQAEPGSDLAAVVEGWVSIGTLTSSLLQK